MIVIVLLENGFWMLCERMRNCSEKWLSQFSIEQVGSPKMDCCDKGIQLRGTFEHEQAVAFLLQNLQKTFQSLWFPIKWQRSDCCKVRFCTKSLLAGWCWCRLSTTINIFFVIYFTSNSLKHCTPRLSSSKTPKVVKRLQNHHTKSIVSN